MKGLKVQCPGCKRVCFETTDRFDPDETPNGAMVKSLMLYQIDWLTSSTTLASEMTCPECMAPLVQKGRLTILPAAKPDATRLSGDSMKVAANDLEIPIRDGSPQMVVEGNTVTVVDPANFICPECKREFKSGLALRGHKKAHKK